MTTTNWVPWVDCCGQRWLNFWALWTHQRTHGPGDKL
jgi:hypothetical protein